MQPSIPAQVQDTTRRRVSVGESAEEAARMLPWWHASRTRVYNCTHARDRWKGFISIRRCLAGTADFTSPRCRRSRLVLV